MILFCGFGKFGTIWLQQLSSSYFTDNHLEDDEILEDVVGEKSELRIVASDEEPNDEWEKYSSFDSVLFIEKNKEKMDDYHLIGDE